MNERANNLVEKFTSYNNDIISFVESCSDEAWKNVTEGENWPVGVVACHVAKGHYGILAWAKMIVAGEPLPDITMDAIHKMNADQAKENADSTKSEVLDALRKNSSFITDFIKELSEEDLDRTAALSLIDGDVSTQQFIDMFIIETGREHLANMKAAASK